MKNAQRQPSKISCHAPDAKAVFVAGSFNNWKPDIIRLHPHLKTGDW